MTSNEQVFFSLENAENNFQIMKDSNNNHPSILKNIKNEKYAYIDNWSSQLSIVLGKPIKAECKRRGISLMQLHRELIANGYKYNYTSLVNALRGVNPYVINFNYFSRIYEYLSLPYPTMDYLNSFM